MPKISEFPTVTTLAANDYTPLARGGINVKYDLNLTIARDGSRAATADIPFGGHKITGLADGVNPTDGATKEQVDAVASASTAGLALKVNTSDLAATTGAGLVGFKQGGAGAVATTVNSELQRWISPRQFGAKFDGTTDDSAAWQAAFTYAGVTGAQAVIFDGFQSLCSSATRISIPTGVSLFSNSQYEGGDGSTTSSLPTINFSSATGGLTTGARVTIHGIALFGAGATVADHLIEFTGQIGLYNVRLYAGNNGALITKTISTTLSAATIQTPGSGLTNGTYTGKSFTGGGGTGATVNVTVSGGAITNVSFATGGTGYSPYFLYGFAAGALYSGSPALTVVGGITTALMGRSRICNVFVIGSATTAIGLEMDGAFDFTDVIDYHFFAASNNGTSVALRIGRVDGLNIRNPKIFAANTAISLNQPSADPAQPFATIVGCEIDGCNLGISCTAPIYQLNIASGFFRTVGRAITINNPVASVSISGNNILTQSDVSLLLSDFSQASVIGNNFRSNTSFASAPFTYIYVATGTGSGNYHVEGNTGDGVHPFFIADGTAKGGIVGPNNGGFANSGNPTGGYFSSPNATVNRMLPSTGGTIPFTATASDLVINHKLGCIPQTPRVDLIGTAASGANKAIISATATDTISVRIVNTNTGATITTGSFTIAWQA